MPTAAETLADFSQRLSLSQVPAEVVERAKDCIIDTVAVAAFGKQFPWSRMVADYARRYGSGGKCSVIGCPEERLHAPYAALVNGVFAQAFEYDSASHPSHGVHSGATLVPAILAVGEETGADGETALEAFIAGCEVMFRIGAASHHTPEKIGFHAPALIGTYAAAIGAGRMLKLSTEQLTHALGIAGSLSSGLLAFSKSKQGAMVKRLHVGRSAESGVLAARLAASGYTGPETILDGKFGFLETYCIKDKTDATLLTAELGTLWKIMRICIKRYACEKHCQPVIQAMCDLMAEHQFTGKDVASVLVEGSERLSTHHNIRDPGDVMQAQYSVPFAVALALHSQPDNPKSFDEKSLRDSDLRAACHKVTIAQLNLENASALSVRLTAVLHDGRSVSRTCHSFKGMPEDPLSRSELRRKFDNLTTDQDPAACKRMFARLESMENEPVFSLLQLQRP